MTDVELIKSKLDIVDVVSSYVPELKHAGSNFKANCPFHQEKTPSFNVNPTLQIFKCFGCGRAGDVIAFIQEIERVDFPEALKISADKAGVTLSNNKEFDKKNKLEKERIIQANTLTARFYHYILKSHKSGEPGKIYAKKRLIDKERIEQFSIGYASSSRNNLKNFLISKGFEEKELIAFGLLVERNKNIIDKFRERLMQPIINLKGEVVGFSGRYIGSNKEAPKYLNSPETLVYKKNEMLYGLYQAKKFIKPDKKTNLSFLILVEGNIDILSSHRVSVGNIVAPLGTAFTLNQAKLVKRFADQVYFSFDTDEAGTKALVRSLAIAEEIGLKHKVIDLTGYQDADELIVKDPNLWPIRIESALNSVEYLIKKYSEDIDLTAADGKTVFNIRIIPVLSSLKDPILLSHFIKQVSNILEVKEEVIQKEIQNSSKKISYKSFNNDIKESKPVINLKPLYSPTRKLEIYLLILLIQSDNLKKFKIESEFFIDEQCRKIYIKIFESGEYMDFGEISNQLDEELKKLLEEIIMYDTSNIPNIDKEFKNIYNRFYSEYLKREIFKLRKMLNESDNDQTTELKLQELTSKLKALENI